MVGGAGELAPSPVGFFVDFAHGAHVCVGGGRLLVSTGTAGTQLVFPEPKTNFIFI